MYNIKLYANNSCQGVVLTSGFGGQGLSDAVVVYRCV
jgi:hypothetical protein